MNPAGTGLRKGTGGLQWVLGHLVDRVEIPLVKANYFFLSFKSMAGRIYMALSLPFCSDPAGPQQFSPAKLRRMVSPTSPLFSGWNWVP